MTLFTTGLALGALLIASYSWRGLWIACGSTMLSVAVLSGWLFLATVEDTRHVEAGLLRLARQLSPVLDESTLHGLTAAIERVSPYSICDGAARPGCMTAGLTEPPMVHDIDAPPSAESGSEGPQAPQAAATAGWPEAKKDPQEAARSPVIWLLDEPGAPVTSGTDPGFLITGINVSDQNLTRVHGTLKSDSSQREFELGLSIQGKEFEGETAIPAGARFSFGFEVPNTISPKQSGGAIFTFKYTYGEQEKSTILYLTPSMIARSANRG